MLMGKIAFMCELEEGHLLPTFGLAHSLKKRGHEVIYLSVADNENYIEEQGFRCYTSMENLYPKGLRTIQKKNYINPSSFLLLERTDFHNEHVLEVMRGSYDEFIRETNADVYLNCFYMPFDVFMMHYKYNITPVIFSPVLHRLDKTIESEMLLYFHHLSLEAKCALLEFLAEKNIAGNSFKEMVQPLNHIHQLIFCPGEFEVGAPAPNPFMHYIEPSIRDKATTTDIYSLYGIPATKKIMYASMGSQALRHGVTCTVFINKIIQAMQHDDLRDLHLVLAIDSNFNTGNLLSVTDNITIVSWAPQIDILKVASLAIIHGGLGSVKECIYFGVPMIVFPQAHDQPDNAERVVHHNLGFADDIHTVSESSLRYYIMQALTDERIKKGIQRMQRIFREKEDQQEGVSFIESILAHKMFAAES
jgi:zeaxanthin glucosyltransferase